MLRPSCLTYVAAGFSPPSSLPLRSPRGAPSSVGVNPDRVVEGTPLSSLISSFRLLLSVFGALVLFTRKGPPPLSRSILRTSLCPQFLFSPGRPHLRVRIMSLT